MDQKNFIVAIVLSVVIIMGWQALFPPAKPPVNQQQQQTTASSSSQPGTSGTPSAPSGQPTASGAQPAATQIVSRSEALERSPRVTFDTPELVGSIALKGGRLLTSGPATHLMRADTLESIYGIPMGIVTNPNGGTPITFAR